MDFLKQAQGALGGMGGQQGQQQQPNQQQQQGGAAPAQGQPGQPGAAQPGQATGQQDALDKGVGAALNRFGYGQDAATTEKISDGVRSAYKSATGKDIPIQDKQ